MYLSRRDFLKLGGLAVAGLALPPGLGSYRGRPGYRRSPAGYVPEAWRAEPETARLGRITAPQAQLMSRPHPDGKRIGWLYHDDVVRVRRNVVGKGWFSHNHVWVETADGFIYSSLVQPVRNKLNQPMPELPAGGVWTEVTVPYTEGRRTPDLLAETEYRLYYSMILKVDRVLEGEDGLIWYRVLDENGVRMFAQASDFRLIGPQEFEPITPDVEDKLIRVDLKRQRLHAYEEQVEVFQIRVASGVDFFGEDGLARGSLTRPGTYPIWSKRASRHMVGGTPEDGYDLPGVGWVSYFASDGAAIHATYWHNDFGRPKSHGCLNVRPDDAKWLFRWTMPHVSYVPGDITVQWPGGTRIVIEG